MIQLLKHIFRSLKNYSRLILGVALMLLATQLIAFPANATGVYQIPALSPNDHSWILDKGEVLSRLNEGNINSALEKLSKETGNQVRMVTIHRLDYGETIESFTDKLFEKWFPTTEAGANQTLLVIDTLTNNTAIHTGDQVKSLLSDDIVNSVVSETMQVPLEDGNKYNQALSDASVRLVAVLSGQPDPGPPQVTDNENVARTFKTAEETDTKNATVWVIGLLIAATAIPMLTYFFYQGFSG